MEELGGVLAAIGAGHGGWRHRGLGAGSAEINAGALSPASPTLTRGACVVGDSRWLSGLTQEPHRWEQSKCT